MKHSLWILLTALTAATAWATDAPSFAERVERAKTMEDQPAPRQYIEKNIFPLMQDPATVKKMNKCTLAKDASKDKFTMVFDITREGKVAGVDYDRRTNTAQCLAAVWGTVKMSPLPAGIKGNLPIYINWSFDEEPHDK